MIPAPLPLRLPTPEDTDALARALSARVHPGCVLLLEGPVGAGKTAFARALIGTLLHRAGLPPEDVPSPTFTLVQTYATGPFETWHADLYRLTDPSEIMELGLEDAMQDALCLIEWPDRLGAARPPHALTLTLAPQHDDSRLATLSGPPDALARLAPAFAGLSA